MDGVTIDTTNLQILEDFYDDLSTIDQRKIFLSAFKKAAIPIVSAAKMTVPVARGNLWRSIGEKTIPVETAIWVGSMLNTPYITPKGNLSKVWYGLLTEGGAKNVGISRKEKRRGSIGGTISATHWFSSALSSSKAQALEAIEQEWFESINRMIKRTNNKTKK